MKDTVKLMAKRFFEHGVGNSGAALAYYLLFALFPTAIFISNVLGQLDLDVSSVIKWTDDFLPKDIVDIFENYLIYISENSSSSLLGISLVFTLYFPFRAVKNLLVGVRRAYCLEKPKKPLRYAVRQIVFTLLFFVAIALSLVFSTFGKRVLVFLLSHIKLQIPTGLITLWNYLRFVLIGIFMFITVSALYATVQDERQPWSAILPGALLSLTAWVAISVGFSFYVENFAKYSIVYGALGAVMVLLLWLYITAVILIMGAEFNQVIKEKAASRR